MIIWRGWMESPGFRAQGWESLSTEAAPVMVTTFAAYWGASKGRASWANEACDRHRKAATARSRDNFAVRSPNLPDMNKPILTIPRMEKTQSNTKVRACNCNSERK